MSVGRPSHTPLPRARPDGPALPTPIADVSVRPGGLAPDAPAAARIAALSTAVLLGLVLPALMVVANKSAPAVLGAGALAATAAALLGGRRVDLGRRYRALLLSPMAGLVVAVVIVLAASLEWTVDRHFTTRGLVEGLPELVFALGAAAAWPLVAGRRDGRWLVAGLLLAGALMLFEHRAGMPLHALVRARGEAWDLKRSAVPPLLLLWPALLFAWRTRRRWLTAASLILAVVVGIAASHSGAPAAALLLASTLFLVAIAAPRLGIGIMGAGLALLIVTAPWTGSILTRILPADTTVTLSEEHAEHRLTIWKAFENRGFDRPWLGHGFNASYAVADAPRPSGAAPPADSAEIVGFHPHDVVLQVWIELGALGLAVAAIVVASVMRRLAGWRGAPLAARLGLFVSIIGVGLVGLSAWQPWWIASIAVALLWFDVAELQTED